ncbi:MAG: hypothetical protein ACYSUK_00260 [Planctomycetota bacterium]|jgi:hypothetical protein
MIRRVLFVLLLLITSTSVGQEPDWWTFKPLRDYNRTDICADVDAHMPIGHQYRNDDKITWTHETTHAINSIIRGLCGETGNVNAFYVGKDRCIVLKEPKNFKLSTIAEMIPQKYRGHMYQLYLVDQQRWWNNEPLYVLDEWTSYCNGTQYAIEHNYGLDRRAGDIQNTQIMTYFASVLWKAIEKYDPDYVDMERFKIFVTWQNKRVDKLLNR